MVQVIRLLIDAQPWRMDPACPPIPWRQDIFEHHQQRSLTIGILVDDGVVKIHPPVERCLYEHAVMLKAAGHEVIAWDPTLHAECISVMVRIMFSAANNSNLDRTNTILLMVAKTFVELLWQVANHLYHTLRHY